jgi:hypothetical protein
MRIVGRKAMPSPGGLSWNSSASNARFGSWQSFARGYGMSSGRAPPEKLHAYAPLAASAISCGVRRRENEAIVQRSKTATRRSHNKAE